jgi:RNA polymerase-interacting CarD/CdnL/TRCF family regulator
MSKGMQVMVAVVTMTVMGGAVKSPAYERDARTQTGYVMALNLLEETESFLQRPKTLESDEAKAKKEIDAAANELRRGGIKDGRKVAWPRKAAAPEDAAKEREFLARARQEMEDEKELAGHAGMRARVIKDIEAAQELLEVQGPVMVKVL